MNVSLAKSEVRPLGAGGPDLQRPEQVALHLWCRESLVQSHSGRFECVSRMFRGYFEWVQVAFRDVTNRV